MRTSKGLSITHLDTLLKTQLLELAVPELLEKGDRLGLIRKQVQSSLGIDGDTDCTIVDPIINPV